MGVTRALCSELEERLGEKITSEHQLFAWAVRHAGFIPSRSHKSSDKGGTTAFYRSTSTNYTSELLPVADRVMPRMCDQWRYKQSPRLAEGLWVGRPPEQ